MRVAEAYFNVLAAEDALISEQATKEAIGRQLEQASKRFEVGLIAITDVQEAQAAHDQAVAAEILGKRNLANQKEVLRAIIDDYPTELAKPAQDIPLVSPEPADENQWVDLAMRQNLSLISSQIGVEIARDDVRIALRAFAEPRPGGSAQRDRQRGLVDRHAHPSVPDPDTTIVGGVTGTDIETDSIQLQLIVPIFSGGITSAQTKQANYRARAARERLERTARETERQMRDAYLGVISRSRVAALRQALESARTALKATEAGFDVGTCTTVDVPRRTPHALHRRNHHLRSRYDYLLNGLRLQSAAGTLTEDDLARINALLKEPSRRLRRRAERRPVRSARAGARARRGWRRSPPDLPLPAAVSRRDRPTADSAVRPGRPHRRPVRRLHRPAAVPRCRPRSRCAARSGPARPAPQVPAGAPPMRPDCRRRRRR